MPTAFQERTRRSVLHLIHHRNHRSSSMLCCGTPTHIMRGNKDGTFLDLAFLLLASASWICHNGADSSFVCTGAIKPYGSNKNHAICQYVDVHTSTRNMGLKSMTQRSS